MAKKKTKSRSGIRRQTEEFYDQTFPVGGRDAVTTDMAVAESQPMPMDSADLSASPFRLGSYKGGPAPVQTAEFDGEGGNVQQTADCRLTGTCGTGGTTASNPLYATQTLPEYDPPPISFNTTTATDPNPVVVDEPQAEAEPEAEPVAELKPEARSANPEVVTPEEIVPGNVDGMMDQTDVTAGAGADPQSAAIAEMPVEQKLETLNVTDENPDTPVIKQRVAEQGVIDTNALLDRYQKRLDYDNSKLSELNNLPVTTRNQINQIRMIVSDRDQYREIYINVLKQQLQFQSVLGLQKDYQKSPLGVAQVTATLAKAHADEQTVISQKALLPGQVESQKLLNEGQRLTNENQSLQNTQLSNAINPGPKRTALLQGMTEAAARGQLGRFEEKLEGYRESLIQTAAMSSGDVMIAEADSQGEERSAATQMQQPGGRLQLTETQLSKIDARVDDMRVSTTIDGIYGGIEAIQNNPNLAAMTFLQADTDGDGDISEQEKALADQDAAAKKKLIVGAITSSADQAVGIMVDSMMRNMSNEDKAKLMNPQSAAQFIGPIQNRVEGALKLKEQARFTEIASTGTVAQLQGGLDSTTMISDVVRQSVKKKLDSLQSKEPVVNFFGGGLNQQQPPATEVRSGQLNTQAPRGAGT